MANLQERRDRSGRLISYSIRVYRGRGPDGKQLKPYTSTFPVSPNWTERSARKKAEAAAAVFEQQCRAGQISIDGKTLFRDYFQHVRDLLQERGEIRPATVEGWNAASRYILPELGGVKLRDLTPSRVNNFYSDLAKQTKNGRAQLRPGAVFPRGTAARIAESTGLSPSCISNALHGKAVSCDVAERIAAALGQDPFEKLPPEPLSGATQNRIAGVLSSVLSFAEREQVIPQNPARRATPPRVDTGEAQCLEPAEVAALLEAAEQEALWFRLALNLLAFGGLRKGELLGLCVEDVLPDGSGVWIQHSLSQIPGQAPELGPCKTRGSVRIVPLPQHVMDLLGEYLQQEQRRSGVILQLDGAPLPRGKLNYELDSFTRRHGLRKIHPHTFRHSAASALLASGQVDLPQVSRTLGHSRTQTTADIYSHTLELNRARPANVLEQAFQIPQK